MYCVSFKSLKDTILLTGLQRHHEVYQSPAVGAGTGAALQPALSGPWAAGHRAVPAALHSAQPLNASALGSAACRAPFLKCISSSRSLTTEALIKAQINFCQCARWARSVLFLQEPFTCSRRALQGGGLCTQRSNSVVGSGGQHTALQQGNGGALGCAVSAEISCKRGVFVHSHHDSLSHGSGCQGFCCALSAEGRGPNETG